MAKVDFGQQPPEDANIPEDGLVNMDDLSAQIAVLEGVRDQIIEEFKQIAQSVHDQVGAINEQINRLAARRGE